jgi:hypothetical protein
MACAPGHHKFDLLRVSLSHKHHLCTRTYFPFAADAVLQWGLSQAACGGCCRHHIHLVSK